MGATREGFARSRAALRRLPAWLFTAGLFLQLALLVFFAWLVVGDYDTARKIGGFTGLALFVIELIVRGKDSLNIYGTLFTVGAALGFLSLSNEWQGGIQAVVSSALVYLFFDRGWLSDRDADEAADAPAATGQADVGGAR